MRYESSVTSVSWIPSEAVTGSMRVAFDAGFGHYDDPPPDEITDLAGLQAADRFRFANELRAWIDVTPDGQIADAGYSGSGLIGSTTVQLGALKCRFQAAKLPDIQHPPEIGDGRARFVQAVGGRTGAPMQRGVSRKPFIQWQAPLVWTTLALTLRADGQSQFELTAGCAVVRIAQPCTVQLACN
jgi:hypothetical protein